MTYLPDWADLAVAAVHDQSNGRHEAAGQRVAQLVDAHHDRLGEIVRAWAGAVTAFHRIPRGFPVRLSFLSGADTEQDLADVDPEIVWAGRVLAAYVAGDDDHLDALIATVPPQRRRLHLCALLYAVGTFLAAGSRVALGGGS